MTDAQLFWDDQDPKNAGWWLRYTDDDGNEQGVAIDDLNDDASIEDLAGVVAVEIAGDGKVRVFRGEQECGWIKVQDGGEVTWRAL